MVPMTASRKSATSRGVRFFARAWASKKSMGKAALASLQSSRRAPPKWNGAPEFFRGVAASGRDLSRELYFRRVSLGGILDMEELGRQEAEHPGENHVGERFARGVVG